MSASGSAGPALVHDRDAGDTSEYRTLPHNVEAEQSLLGALLINDELVPAISGLLAPDHFFEAVHGRIYHAATKLIELGQAATPITLKTNFEDDDALADVGGASYLARLAGAACGTRERDVRAYATAIRDLALRRELVLVGEDIAGAAVRHDINDSVQSQIAAALERLDALQPGGEGGGPAQYSAALDEALAISEAAYQNGGVASAIPTGFAELDRATSGLARGEFWIAAGRPSMGKTASAHYIAEHAARAGHPTVFFSLEMNRSQLGHRALSRETQISFADVRAGRINEDDFLRLAEAKRTLDALPLFIDDSRGLTVHDIAARARRLIQKSGIALVVIDYLQLIQPGARYRGNRTAETSEISAALQAMAGNLDVAVLALSQLNRGLEGRDDKRPGLADLRDSGALEQDADTVLMLHREAYYAERDEPRRKPTEDDITYDERRYKWRQHLDGISNVLTINIAKQRQGPAPLAIDVWCDLATARFGDLEGDQRP